MQNATYLYLIKSGSAYKIGIAKDTERRMEQLQTGNPFELEMVSCFQFVDPQIVERALHQAFYDVSIRGEWFALTSVQLAQFDRICIMLRGVRVGSPSPQKPEPYNWIKDFMSNAYYIAFICLYAVSAIAIFQLRSFLIP